LNNNQYKNQYNSNNYILPQTTYSNQNINTYGLGPGLPSYAYSNSLYLKQNKDKQYKPDNPLQNHPTFFEEVKNIDYNLIQRKLIESSLMTQRLNNNLQLERKGCKCPDQV